MSCSQAHFVALAGLPHCVWAGSKPCRQYGVGSGKPHGGQPRSRVATSSPDAAGAYSGGWRGIRNRAPLPKTVRPHRKVEPMTGVRTSTGGLQAFGA
eukprot:14223560-Alexandrium_andersonii.AAC.1